MVAKFPFSIVVEKLTIQLPLGTVFLPHISLKRVGVWTYLIAFWKVNAGSYMVSPHL